MSLEARLSALAVRLGTALKQRGLPAGGTAGQVLGKIGAADYVVGWLTPAGGSSAPADLADGLPGSPSNGVLALFAAPRALKWTAGGISLGTASSAALTLSVLVNGAAAATLSLPANTLSGGALSQTVTLAAGDRVSIVLSGAGGGEADLTYWLRGEAL